MEFLLLSPCYIRHMADFFDPSTEEQNIVLILEPTLRKIEKLIFGCESCSPEGAQLHFEVLLDAATGSDPASTDYILEMPAKCPMCRGDVLEATLVEFETLDD
jgi:hypothetical protein